VVVVDCRDRPSFADAGLQSRRGRNQLPTDSSSRSGREIGNALSKPILEIEDLTVQYRIESRYLTAVDDVSFAINAGDALGIVGESGSGKSTLAFAVLGILPENARVTSGRVLFEGRDLLQMSEAEVRREVRWKKISMIFQSSMNALNPVYRVGSTLADVARYKEGLSQSEAEKKVASLYELVGIDPSRMRSYPHQYSGGMKQRAVIAMSLICKPVLILADEPTTALDVVVQDQILKKLKELQKELGISFILISHDVGVIGAACERVAVMYGGKVFEMGFTKELFSEPNNPYTRALLQCFPDLKNPKKRLKGIPREISEVAMSTTGCLFAPRCAYAKDICRSNAPPMHEVKPGHFSLCHFAKELV